MKTLRRKSPACVLVSGGLDSAILLGETLERHAPVHPVFVRCGLAWESAELHWLRRFLRALRAPRLRPLSVLDLPAAPLYGRHWSLTGRGVPGYRSADERVQLPGRNLLLAGLAAVFCAKRGIPAMYLGVLRGNPFPDGAPRFFRAMETALRAGLGRRVSVRAPFARLRKTEVLARGRGLPLHLTFSCLAPRGVRPCGRCNKCAEREKALAAAVFAFPESAASPRSVAKGAVARTR